MAGPGTAHIPLALASILEAALPEEAELRRRRRISPQAGHALEVLGHAIDYLDDQYICRFGPFPPAQADVEAWELLKKLNRQIYLACPVIPTWSERLRSLLSLN